MSTDLHWFKSSYSGSEGGNCIEVATCPHTVHIRDSKDLTVPALAVSPTSWTPFVEFTAS
ncbi:DUF397 domain-containing protein [Streptomyces anulatus]|uniref:DUF397 domain-containing protein n=1 Tax=Streptomyces anulatus TaxID=1892 RepID=UPI002254E840|nr:DUF397 domain-containing protein [Streptomyces anulatus]MCX4489547.1 DUF397 domain-containing protein [Streptomyces anulatus]WSU75390.1 DUF397 domain-containing protein [Streptomyces anulatus]